MTIVSIEDFRRKARKTLPPFLFEYIDGGSYDEVTLDGNRRALLDTALKQRVLKDVSQIDFTTQLFGRIWDMPVALAPVGLSGMNARRGEVQAVRAAENKGVPFCLSTVGVCPIEEVAAAASQPFWFQLYMIRDRGFMIDLLTKAQEAGCDALVFTVDMPLPGTRYRDFRSGLAGNPGMLGEMRRYWQAVFKPKWSVDVGLLGRPHHLGNIAPVLGQDSGMEDFLTWMKNNFDPTLTWDDLAFIRQHWDGPIIIKGILDPEDAKEAVQQGLDGLIVSNHGGRQLDGVLPSATALPIIADAVGDDLTLMADGGIRTGLDVVRMLALGASAVMVGRAWAYALAADGQSGVETMLDLLKEEMRVAMSLTGVTSIDQINRACLA